MNSTLVQKDIFGPGSRFDCRWVKTYDEMAEKVAALRKLNQRIVLTMGTFDILHIGHFRYLEKAKEHGDVLVVGVDSDEKVKRRKGPNRPIVGHDERLEALAHIRHVDLIFLKGVDNPKWQLIKTVQPDILIATQDAYGPEQVEALNEFCGQVVVLEPQATTRTTAKIRRLLVEHLVRLEEALKSARGNITSDLDSVLGLLEGIKGGKV